MKLKMFRKFHFKITPFKTFETYVLPYTIFHYYIAKISKFLLSDKQSYSQKPAYYELPSIS